MEVNHQVHHEHRDLVHDVAYDFYGRRMATCSSDQTIKIWDVAEDGSWKKTIEFKAHQGSIWRLSWAHPEFGQILASCSFDNTVSVWEDDISGDKWLKRVELNESKVPVNDVKFAPRHFGGLRLATCCDDGAVRVYEATDIVNLAAWTVQGDFKCKAKAVAISWGTSTPTSPMLAVGVTSPVVSVQVFLCEELRRWTPLLDIPVAHGTGPTTDVSFAPYLGRSFNLLTFGCSAGLVHIWKVTAGSQVPATTQHVCTKPHHHPPKSGLDSPVALRVSWNVTGTILASAADDGTVRVWRQKYYEDEWTSEAPEKRPADSM